MPALKKPAKSKPSAPKKPSSKSKTGNSACSQAASNWQLSIRGKEALNPDTYATLAKCRAMTSTKKKAMLNEASGKLSAQGKQALEGRLQKRFDQGLITQKSRDARLKELLAARKAKQTPPPAQPPAIDKTRSLVERVRQSEKYGITRTYGRAVQSDVSKALVTARNANEMVNAKADTGRMPTAKNLANTVARTERRSRVAEKKGQVVSGFQNFPDSAIYNSTLARQMKRSWFPNVTITPAAQKPAPAAPAFSRNGQLAPGRGTEERKRADLLNEELDYRDQQMRITQLEQKKVDASIRAKLPQSRQTTVYAEDTQLPSSMGGGKKGYVAKITGTHPKYKLDRQFLRGRNDGAGTEYTITERGIYETQTRNMNQRARTDRIYELHGRNKTRLLMPHIPGGSDSLNKDSVDRVVRLLERIRSARAAR